MSSNYRFVLESQRSNQTISARSHLNGNNRNMTIVIFRITFPISPLCHVQTFQTPCIYLHSHISLGFLWPSSFFQLFRKKLFQASPPAARQDIGHTFRLAAFHFQKLWSPGKLPFSCFFLKQQFNSPLKLFLKTGFSSVVWTAEPCLWTTLTTCYGLLTLGRSDPTSSTV